MGCEEATCYLEYQGRARVVFFEDERNNPDAQLPRIMNATFSGVSKGNMNSIRFNKPTFGLLFLASFYIFTSGTTQITAAGVTETTFSLYKSTDHGTSWYLET